MKNDDMYYPKLLILTTDLDINSTWVFFRKNRTLFSIKMQKLQKSVHIYQILHSN